MSRNFFSAWFRTEGVYSKKLENDKQAKEYEKKFRLIEHYYQEGEKQTISDNYDHANKLIDKGRELSPQCANLIQLKAAVFALQIRIVAAKDVLTKLDNKDKKNGWYYFTQGVINYHDNDLTRSISGFVEAKKTLQKAKGWHEKVTKLQSLYQSGKKNMSS